MNNGIKYYIDFHILKYITMVKIIVQSVL